MAHRGPMKLFDVPHLKRHSVVIDGNLKQIHLSQIATEREILKLNGFQINY